MTVNSGFFNSVAGDRKYDANWFADYFASFIGNGVFPNPSNNLQVIAQGNMQTVVKPGKGWINGYYVTNTEDLIFQHDIGGPFVRNDRIVLQKSTADRSINIVLKKANSSLVRNADFYELVLADVRIQPGATSISQSNITDQRLNKNLCGIVHGVVDQVDTTTIFNQYQSWFNEYSETKVQEFLDWQNQTKQAIDDWINSEHLDFETWRTGQENLFIAWSNQRQDNYSSWFNGIKDQLSTVEIGAHMMADMPHQFIDQATGTTYRYGWKLDGGVLKFVYEEVI